MGSDVLLGLLVALDVMVASHVFLARLLGATCSLCSLAHYAHLVSCLASLARCSSLLARLVPRLALLQTDLTFGREFTNAVEQKQIAQQEAERARFVVEKAEQEKAAAIIRAEGEAAAADLISQAYKKSGMGHIELRRLEAAKEIAGTLATARNVTYLPGSGEGKGGQTLLLNIGQQ